MCKRVKTTAEIPLLHRQVKICWEKMSLLSVSNCNGQQNCDYDEKKTGMLEHSLG